MGSNVGGRAALALVCALLSVAGCARSGGGGAGAHAGASGAAGQGTGVLAQRAAAFEDRMQRLHLGQFGLVADVKLDASGQVIARGGPSRPLWTGVYAAAQAMRWKATRDPAAHAAMERALWSLHHLAQIVGIPGVIARGYDVPSLEPNGIPATTPGYVGYNYDRGKPSRDQYTGWFFGLAIAYDEVTDPALRSALQDDCRAIAQLLEQHDLAPVVAWDGRQQELFDLNPGATRARTITPQEWARVDDFPLNLIVKAVPYDPQIAAALAQIQLPPVRAGEAARAVMFLTVAAYVTGDPAIRAYRDRLLWGPKDFATVVSRYTLVFDDACNGRNMAAVRTILGDLGTTVARFVDILLQAQGRSAWVRALAQPLVGGITSWIMNQVVDLFEFLTNPNNQQRIDRVRRNLALASTLLRLVGYGGLADEIDRFLHTYGPHLNRQGLRELADAMRAYNGFNLSLLADVGVLAVEQDPAIRAIFQDELDRRWWYVRTEKNAWFNVLHARYGSAPGPQDLPDAIESLRRYWSDPWLWSVDNSGWPGLRVTVWPDRFGRVGNRAAEPVAFPIDVRQPHLFPWQNHPREIVSRGHDPDVKIAPLGYLAPYWFAREMGALGPAD
ncbi:MAG: hypothetical protein D6776_04135 [Planctomycetota bacterium]|nr:MAG: hypothetical protein D6776_04135 [Planctomycetota bacterium]